MIVLKARFIDAVRSKNRGLGQLDGVVRVAAVVGPAGEILRSHALIFARTIRE